MISQSIPYRWFESSTAHAWLLSRRLAILFIGAKNDPQIEIWKVPALFTKKESENWQEKKSGNV
jgi:hypothetical protein